MSGPSESLGVAWNLLEQQWERTRRVWRDSQGIEFERRFWREIHQQTRDLRSAAAALEDTLARALRNCD